MPKSEPRIPKLVRKWVTVGIVLKPFGRRGEVKVRLETSFPERFSPKSRLYAWRPSPDGPAEKPFPLIVRSARDSSGTLLIGFEGVETIDQADDLRGAWLMVPREERMPTPQDEYYVSDLIGIDVYTLEGEHLGKLANVIQTPAHDVYEVGKLLIPAVKAYVQNVDMVARRMTVRKPEDAD